MKSWLRPAAAAWFLGLLAFALWTREPLRREGLWRDEALSVYIARAPSLSELLRRNRIADYNPPLFNLIVAGYGRIAGFDETPLKVFAVALGLLALAAVALLAREIGGGFAACLAAATAVNNPIVIGMSAELRPYSMSVFLCLLSLYAAFRLRRRSRGVRTADILWLTPLLALLVYSHIAGGIVAAVLGAWGFLAWRREPAVPFGRVVAVSALLACGTFLFWLPATWRQVRVGIPYEPPFTVGQNLHSLLERSRDLMPVPQGFGQPPLVLSLAVLTVVAVPNARRVCARLRESKEFLIVSAAAAGSVWIVLGLFSRQSRYLLIPAALAAVIFGVLLRAIVEARFEAQRPYRIAALVGAAGLMIGTFSARADFYADLLSASSRPKSGIRTLCRNSASLRRGLVVLAPDYLATTFWYYCGAGADAHGFPRWDDAALLDLKEYASLWGAPSAVPDAISRIGRSLEETNRSRFELVFEDTGVGPPLFYGARVRKLEREIARLYDEGRKEGLFRGRMESVQAVTWIRRSENKFR